MSTVKKKKVKIKKKNFTIFLLCIVLIVFGITKGVIKITAINESPKKETKNETKQVSKTKSDKQQKLEKLGNLQKELEYFNFDYLDRYISYKENNKSLSNKQVIKDVNMNLDKKHYDDAVEAKNLNKPTILVNKYYSLAKDYVPDNLEPISTNYALSNMKLVSYAREAFEELAQAAKKEKLNIVAMSTYRSYDYQVELYNRYVQADGKEAADTYSGRPGHSEHQTGLAVDVFNNKESYTNFDKTKEFVWMKVHAYEYGFILRFPEDKVKETGYQYESWHYRYVGKEIAKYIKDNNISFEEYYATKIKS